MKIITFSLFSLLLLSVFVNSIPSPGGFDTKFNYLVPDDALLTWSPSGIYMTHSNGTKEFHPNDPNAEGRKLRDSGWVSSAFHSPPQPSNFTASWIVPKAPENKSNQLLYFFNSYMDSGYKGIIQPVLQYGVSSAGGKPDNWYIASWYVTSTGQAHYTTATPVNPGDKITGVMYEQSGVWIIQSWVNGKNVQSLKVQNLPPQTTVQVCMEVYTVNSCNEFPSGDYISFNGMNIKGEPWQIRNDQTDCGTSTECKGTDTCNIWFHQKSNNSIQQSRQQQPQHQQPQHQQPQHQQPQHQQPQHQQPQHQQPHQQQ